MSITIHADVITELRDMAEIIGESCDPEDYAYAGQLNDAAASMEFGEKPTGLALAALDSELSNWRGKDAYWQDKAWHRRLTEAMARMGLLEEFNPDAFYSRRPTTRKVDGTRWVI